MGSQTQSAEETLEPELTHLPDIWDERISGAHIHFNCWPGAALVECWCCGDPQSEDSSEDYIEYRSLWSDGICPDPDPTEIPVCADCATELDWDDYFEGDDY